ncbi:hypothetical protein pqer_cds_295 [Pandoravirus quercus]|uniref:Uncharacterized protein n=1 Tax=Pandoravirus quercus TaxID=2107709 RepID=A0A2U7U8G1_9VIRU|nr:hypothetical protein pqer_cds_295 [Pandoravirus quercus]AVK74717.1 hypothetical protein pqer_cds_295 [Pandoravirus quercus]
MADRRRVSRYEPVTPPGSSPDTPILIDAPRPRVGTKRRRPPPFNAEQQILGEQTPGVGGAVTYSPMLPHGFAVRLSPGAVDAGTAARAAFSLACLRSTGPVCRNVVGPLAHTLGRYFAGGGRVTVVGRTGSTRDYRSVEALVATRRAAFASDDARAAARRWLAACALAQVSPTRWHPRRFTPSDAVLDTVYAHLAEAAAPADLLRVAPIEMHAWLQRADDLRARLSWALLHATTVSPTATNGDDDGASLCTAGATKIMSRERVDAGRLALALDTLRREPGLPVAAPLALLSSTVTKGTASRLGERAPNLCGCPSAHLCTAWGPERSVGAWQRSAMAAVVLVAATPARALDDPPLVTATHVADPVAGATATPIDDSDHTIPIIYTMTTTPTTTTARQYEACATTTTTTATTKRTDPVDPSCDERIPCNKRAKTVASQIVASGDPLLLRLDGTDDDRDCPLLGDTAAPTPPPCAGEEEQEVGPDESFWQWLDEQFPCEPLPFLSSSSPSSPPLY